MNGTIIGLTAPISLLWGNAISSLFITILTIYQIIFSLKSNSLGYYTFYRFEIIVRFYLESVFGVKKSINIQIKK